MMQFTLFISSFLQIIVQLSTHFSHPSFTQSNNLSRRAQMNLNFPGISSVLLQAPLTSTRPLVNTRAKAVRLKDRILGLTKTAGDFTKEFRSGEGVFHSRLKRSSKFNGTVGNGSLPKVMLKRPNSRVTLPVNPLQVKKSHSWGLTLPVNSIQVKKSHFWGLTLPSNYHKKAKSQVSAPASLPPM